MNLFKSIIKLSLIVSFSLVYGQEKPNIVLIMLDDVSPDMYSAYGQPNAAQTPNVDKLAERGVMFKTCYASAMCGPSRVEIMTGLYGTTTGVTQNGLWAGNSRTDVYKDHQAFGKLLKDQGYATAIAGKWQESSDNSTWTDVSTGSGYTSSNFTSASLTSSKYYRFAASCDNSSWVYSSSTLITVPGSNIYVTTSGNDVSGDGSISSPYATLTKALTDAASCGGTINIGAGTFTDDLVIS